MAILIVEDSRAIQHLLTKKIHDEIGVECYCASSLAKAKELLEEKKESIDIAVSGLNLPDALHGEVIDLLSEEEIPTLVFTGSFDPEMRKKMLEKGVVDYTIKSSEHSFDYSIKIIKRLYKNPSIKVLVVDDSNTSRKVVGALLSRHRYKVIEAVDGEDALKKLKEHPDIKLVITDEVMPKMPGHQLVKQLRKEYGYDQIQIIGMSAHGNSLMTVEFIKSGANDFIIKPFTDEEFICRVTQTIEMMELVEMQKAIATMDYMTKLHNRKYLFEAGALLFDSAKKSDTNISVALIDIDFFKAINDSYGHDIGDAVLIEFARLLKVEFLPPSISARMGGEEFCIIIPNEDEKSVKEKLEQFRQKVEKLVISLPEQNISFTISIGHATKLSDSLQEMIKEADRLMYNAKESGRNKVISD